MSSVRHQRRIESSSDQVRVVLVTGAGTPLPIAGNELLGVFAAGGGQPMGAGYSMIVGMVEADQSFTVDIAQGATTGNQGVTHQFASQVDPITGRQVVPIKWPAFGEFFTVDITNTSGNPMTVYERTLYLLPHDSPMLGLWPEYPGYVQGADPVGAAPTFNPFIWAGVNGLGNTARGGVTQDAQVFPTTGMPIFMRDDAGNGLAVPGNGGATYDYLYSRLTDGSLRLTLGNEDDAAPSTAIMAGAIYRAVKQALEDGDTALLQTDAYGNLEIAGYNRAIGSIQVVEQAPIQYDTSVVTVRASAALPAAGAFDAAPTEIPTGGRRYLLLVHQYTRAAAGGSFRHRVRTATTVGGTDYWAQAVLIQNGAFAAGADVNSLIQREDFEYQATGAAAELIYCIYDLGRAHKVRVPSREVGAVANPGTLLSLGILFNG